MLYHWPFLDFVGAKDIHSFAERCVGTLLGKILTEQLGERKVVAFGRLKMLASGVVCLVGKPRKGFGIYLADTFNLSAPNTDACVTFAHELGHTFCTDLSTFVRLPHTDYEKLKGQKRDNVLDSVEEFVEDFSYLWMSFAEHRKQLENFLKAHQHDIVIPIASLESLE